MLGDRVRLRLPAGAPIEADFRGWSADRMLLHVDGVADDWPVSVFDLASLEVHTDRTRREGLRHYAIIGAVAGLFVGAGIGLALYSSGITRAPDAPPEQIVTSTLKGAGLGTVGGLLGGAFLGGRHPGTGWIVLSLPAR